MQDSTVEVGNTFGAGMAELTPAGWEMVTAFRVGYSTGTPCIAPRRAVSDAVAGMAINIVILSAVAYVAFIRPT